MFFVLVDVLSKRYGWSYTDIAENMYWEDVYEIYEYASNLEAIEQNEQMKFQFLLHAQTKNALKSWKDADVPFPAGGISVVDEIPVKKIKKVETFTETLDPLFKRHAVPVNKNISEEERKKNRERAEEVRRRVLETQEKAKKMRENFRYNS